MKNRWIFCFMFFCIFLVGCGVKSNTEDASEIYSNGTKPEETNENKKQVRKETPKVTNDNTGHIEGDKSEITKNKELDFGDNEAIYVAAFPISLQNDAYVIKIDETATITTYRGKRKMCGDTICSDMELICEDITKVLDCDKKSSESLSDKQIKEINRKFKQINFKYIKRNMLDYAQGIPCFPVSEWEYSLWVNDEGSFWYQDDEKSDDSGMMGFIRNVIKMSPIKVK